MDNFADYMSEFNELMEYLSGQLPDDEVRLFQEKLESFSKTIVRGGQITDSVWNMNLYGREMLWLYELATSLVDNERDSNGYLITRSPDQRQTEISYRVLGLSYLFGLSKGYDLGRYTENPTPELARRLWNKR